MTTDRREALREALDTLRNNDRTDSMSPFWNGWDAALAAVNWDAALAAAEAARAADPPALDVIETRCPLVGVHEHAFRGPHRFREWDPADADEPTEHSGKPHEFRTVCRLCGEPGWLHVSIITQHERVDITDARLAREEKET